MRVAAALCCAPRCASAGDAACAFPPACGSPATPAAMQAAAAKRAAERVRKKAAKAATAAAEKAAADARKAEEKAEKARARAEVKATPKPRKRSEEHNRKIAEAIKRKWEDPTYRGKVTARPGLQSAAPPRHPA